MANRDDDLLSDYINDPKILDPFRKRRSLQINFKDSKELVDRSPLSQPFRICGTRARFLKKRSRPVSDGIQASIEYIDLLASPKDGASMGLTMARQTNRSNICAIRLSVETIREKETSSNWISLV